jgi:anti-sigma B factor antagonist
MTPPNEMDPRFAVREESLGRGAHLIAVEGEVDVAAAPEIERRLNEAVEAGTAGVVIDLSGASEVDSPMLRVLIRGYRRLGWGNGRFAVVCSDPAICKVFEITGLDEMLEVVASREEALAAVGAAAAETVR